MSIGFFQTTYSQNAKKVIYLDYDNKVLNKEQYDSFDERVIYTKKTENDTAVIHKVFLRKKVAKLDSIQHYQINMYLEKLIGKDFKSNKNTMIHLYNQNDEKIVNDANHKSYWNYIKKNSKKYQTFLIGTKYSELKNDPKKPIYLDSKDIFKNIFFKDSEFAINHLFIKPNGDIYIYYGIDDILYVLDLSV